MRKVLFDLLKSETMDVEIRSMRKIRVWCTDFDRIEAPKYENRSRKRKKISFRLPPCSLSEWNWKKCDQSHARFNEHCKNWFSILFSRQGYNYAGILSDQLYLERTEKRSVRNVKTKSSLLIFPPPSSSLFLRSVLATIQTLPDGRFNSRVAKKSSKAKGLRLSSSSPLFEKLSTIDNFPLNNSSLIRIKFFSFKLFNKLKDIYTEIWRKRISFLSPRVFLRRILRNFKKLIETNFEIFYQSVTRSDLFKYGRVELIRNVVSPRNRIYIYIYILHE